MEIIICLCFRKKNISQCGVSFNTQIRATIMWASEQTTCVFYLEFNQKNKTFFGGLFFFRSLSYSNIYLSRWYCRKPFNLSGKNRIECGPIYHVISQRNMNIESIIISISVSLHWNKLFTRDSHSVWHQVPNIYGNGKMGRTSYENERLNDGNKYYGKS